MSKRGLVMSITDVEAHQRKHGFLTDTMRGVETPVAASKPIRGSRQPNKTESEFRRILEARIARGELMGPVLYEAVKLRLGEKCWYTPDFLCFTPFGKNSERWPIFFEVKGAHIWDDSKVKFKVAVEQHPWAFFDMWQKKQGEWRRIA